MRPTRFDGTPWGAILAALAATLVAIGLARFSYTPLLPAVIAAGWFAPAEAAYLGAANLAGYLAGAAAGGPLARRLGAPASLRLMMLLAAASFFACARPAPFAWFLLWRVVSGIAGGAIIVTAAPTVLAYVPASRRGMAGGIIFTGVGLGIAASGTLVPVLIGAGLTVAWCGLGAVMLVLTLTVWTAWPPGISAGRAAAPVVPLSRSLIALYAAYGLNAVGLVPHMVFIVDFIARGLGQGIAVGAAYWVLVGIGAALGPGAAGLLADRIGFVAALRLGFVIQAAAVGLLAVADGPAALIVSSLIGGAFIPGIVPLVLGRIHMLLPGDAVLRQRAWSVATVAFATGQAGAAYAFSLLFAAADGYAVMFALAAAALIAALAVEVAGSLGGVSVAAARRPAAPGSPSPRPRSPPPS